MDPSIVALFPDRFVESELGEMPEGWGVGALGDMLELLSGGIPKTSVAEYWDGDIPWYTAKDAPTLSDIFVVETERRITQTFKLIDAIIPSPKLADKFETVVQPIMSHILSNLHESRALTALRDMLLPKLISGELRVNRQWARRRL